jgi:hypothetical protein
LSKAGPPEYWIISGFRNWYFKTLQSHSDSIQMKIQARR